jgi:hypothetical protein
MVSAVSLAALAASGIAYAEDPAATTTQPKPAVTETQNSQQPAMPDPNNTTAQQNTTQQNTTTQQPTVTEPDATAAQSTTTTTDPNATSTDPSATTAQKPAVTTDPNTTVTQDATQPAQPTGTAIAVTDLDPAKSTMASNWIGSSVYSSGDENVGDINDIVLSSDGAAKAVIIGVGGFLGMGEKDVAVPMDQISMSKDENGNVKLMIKATRADLEATPAFDRTHFTVGTVQQ